MYICRGHKDKHGNKVSYRHDMTTVIGYGSGKVSDKEAFLEIIETQGASTQALDDMFAILKAESKEKGKVSGKALSMVNHKILLALSKRIADMTRWQSAYS